jgi:hypothetical protein
MAFPRLDPAPLKNSKKTMRLPGIEPGSPAWKADIIPLDHKRFGKGIALFGLINVNLG